MVKEIDFLPQKVNFLNKKGPQTSKKGFASALPHLTSIIGIETTQKWESVSFRGKAKRGVFIFVKIYPKIDFRGVKIVKFMPEKIILEKKSLKGSKYIIYLL